MRALDPPSVVPMAGTSLVSLLPRVEDPLPDTIGVGIIFSIAGAGGVVMLVLGSMLGLSAAELDAWARRGVSRDLQRARSSTPQPWWGRYYEDNAPHFDSRPSTWLCSGSCRRDSADGLDRNGRRRCVRLPLPRHVRIQRFSHLARAHTPLSQGQQSSKREAAAAVSQSFW